MAWHPAEADTCAFVAQSPDSVHDMTNERVFRIFALNCLQARHWVWLENNIVIYRIHVPIIVQCQCNGCSLSSKDSAVIWESLGQLVAGRLTILEMVVDDRCCSHPLVDLRSISVDFIMWSLSIMILSEFCLNLFSTDHKFTHSFNEVVFRWVIFMYFRRKYWCLWGADLFYIDLCRGHGFL